MKRLPEGYFPWVHVMARITHSVPAPISAGFYPPERCGPRKRRLPSFTGPRTRQNYNPSGQGALAL